jgi:hypothetical protein
MARLATLGAGGIYRAALAGLATPGLAESLAHATAVTDLIARLLAVPGVDAVRLGLNKASLLALQAVVRKWEAAADCAPLTAAAAPVLRALESIYQEQSGAAFESCAAKAVAAIAAAEGYHRHAAEDGQLYYSDPSASTVWDAPAPVLALLDALLDVDMMSRRIEDEAVTAVPVRLIAALSAALKSHQVRERSRIERVQRLQLQQ